MADICDMAQDIIEQELDRNLAKTRIPYALPAGREGECEVCGFWSERLILGACARCRQTRHLP